jgi:protein-S-isoprenylcysteine O-methyltransferase Ste14
MPKRSVPIGMSTPPSDASERLFRALTAAVLVVGVGISARARRRANRAGGSISSRIDGRNDVGAPSRPTFVETSTPVALLRLAGLGLLAVVFGYVVAPERVAWARVRIPTPFRWVGAVVCALCLPLFRWTLGSLGDNLTPTDRPRVDAALVTAGPYRYIRHPLYAFGTLFSLGLGLLTGLWPVFAMFAATAAFLRRRVPHEEANLEARFGDDYRDYVRQTGRYWPRF